MRYKIATSIAYFLCFVPVAFGQALPDELAARVGRITADETSSQPAASISKEEIEKCIAELVPYLGAANLLDREPGQQAFERIAVAVTAPGRETQRGDFCKAAARHLSPQFSLHARLWILRQLGIVGNAQCFPEIADGLRDGDPLIREATRRAMQRMKLPECLNALSNALTGTSDPIELDALLNSLAEFDPPPVRVIAPLVNSKNEMVSNAAIHALARCQEMDSTVPLFSLYKDNDLPAVKKLVVQTAILRLAEEFYRANDREQASKIHKLMRGGPGFPPIRAAIMQGRVMVLGAEYIPDLFAMIESKDAELLRKTAAQMLTEIQGKLGERIAKRLVHADLPAQSLYLRVLADRGETESAPLVEALLLAASDDGIRIDAITALGRLGNEKHVATLSKYSASNAASVQAAARTALVELRGDATDAMLVEKAKSGAGAVRAECIRAIEKRGCNKPIDELLTFAADSDSTVAKAAFDALAALGSEADAPRLLSAMMAASDDVASKAESAFAKLATRNPDVEKRALPVLAAMNSAPGNVQPRLIRVLGRLGGDAALTAIRKASNSDDEAILDASVRALCEWPTASVLDDLKKLAESAKSNAHRVLALRGFVRLIRLPSDRTIEESVRNLETAMSLAKSLNETKLALAAVGEVKHPKALAMAREMMGEDALAPEAAMAAINVARGIAVDQPAECAATLAQVRANSKCGPAANKAADELSSVIESRKGFLGHWEFVGPWSIKDAKIAQIYETTFPPEPGTATTAQMSAPAVTDWRPLDARNANDPWIFDLTKISKDRNCCLYARTTIKSKNGGPATLEIGSDDGVVVWLNGKLIHTNKSARPITVGEDKVSVSLQPGENTLLLKVVQGDGGWGFCCALKSPEGAALQSE